MDEAEKAKVEKLLVEGKHCMENKVPEKLPAKLNIR